MSELTEREKEVLAELDQEKMLKIVGRKHPEYTDEVAEKSAVLKELVYKDMANFSIQENFYGYLFLSRTLAGGKRF